MAGHHSPRRGLEFFSRKVVSGAIEIAAKRQANITLGPLSRRQDWGWADNFVEGQQAILEQLPPGTYTMGTNTPHSNEDFVRYTFNQFGLDWKSYVEWDAGMKQPTDVEVLSAETSPELLEVWKPNTDLPGLIRWMIRENL